MKGKCANEIAKENLLIKKVKTNLYQKNSQSRLETKRELKRERVIMKEAPERLICNSNLERSAPAGQDQTIKRPAMFLKHSKSVLCVG